MSEEMMRGSGVKMSFHLGVCPFSLSPPSLPLLPLLSPLLSPAPQQSVRELMKGTAATAAEEAAAEEAAAASVSKSHT